MHMQMYYVHASYTLIQIGNKEEVMYFSANSDQDRNDWIEAFRIGISLNLSLSGTYTNLSSCNLL